MSKGETKPAKTTSTKLSVSAASFVPSKQQHTKYGHAAMNRNDLQNVPKYVTSCYPFVKDPNSPVRPGRWQTPTNRAPAVFAGQHMATPDLYTYTGSRPPGYPFANHHGHHMQGYGLRQPFANQSPVGAISAFPGHPYNVYYQQQAIAPPSPAWVTSNPYQDCANVAHLAQPITHSPVVISYKTADSSTDFSQGTIVTKKIAEAEVNPMVSVGVQNDRSSSWISSSSNKVKTKTIILMDAAIQTDFSEEVANLTLAEKPNSLYKKSNKRPRRRNLAIHSGAITSTDSEEVDSDSGYSSPLHRRNQTSNGTHPVGPSGLVYSGNLNRLSGGYNNFGASSFPSLNNSFDSPMFARQYGGRNDSAQGSVLSQGYATMTPSTSGQEAPSSVSSCQSSSNYRSYSIVVGTMPTETLSEPAPENVAQEDDSVSGTTKKKRKRNRRRRRKTTGSDLGALSDEPGELKARLSGSNLSHHASSEHLHGGSAELHFEDEDEFPDLLCSTSTNNQASHSGRVFTYSDILKQTPSSPILSQELQFKSQDSQDIMFRSQESYRYTSPLLLSPPPPDNVIGKVKNARKRRKRQDQANKAAEAELAEISIEQQMLKEIGVQKHKSKQPVTLNIALMIDALEKQQEDKKEKEDQEKSEKALRHSVGLNEGHAATVLNPLDASGVTIKRGKEREIAKAKKPSSLKKVILKEREEKKKLLILEDGTESWETIATTNIEYDEIQDDDFYEEPPIIDTSDLSQDAMSSKASMSSSMDIGTASADLSPISQTSPIIMSPLSCSPLNSGINSPIAGLGFRLPEVSIKIHSRRFREYCNQILDKDIDDSCTMLLQELVRFQDRLFHKDPIKARAKRRIVLGLREVTKHLKLKKLKCVVISPNLERIQSKGGLDEALNKIIYLCSEQNIPFVFALGRRALGRACAKLVPVSVAGIFNYEGAEEHFNKLMELTVKARQAYKDMVVILEKEAQESNYNGRASTGSMLLAHMGHSRTPSASSAISFSSSILSEPICENYPHSEPETDSKGYEVVKKLEILNRGIPQITNLPTQSRCGNIGGTTNGSNNASPRESAGSDISADSRENSPDKVGSALDIDDGHEADTEDMNDAPTVSRAEESRSKDKCMKFIDTGAESVADDLPHIDSIHSSSIDLNAEILSQHSSKTAEANADVLSTHSSKTLGEVSSVAEKHVKQTLEEVVSEVNGLSLSNSQKLKSVNKERIESWVAETATVMGGLKLTNDSEQRDSPRLPSTDQRRSSLNERRDTS